MERINGNAESRQKNGISQENTTTPPGRGTTPISVVVAGPAQHWTGLSPGVLGVRFVGKIDSVADRKVVHR